MILPYGAGGVPGRGEIPMSSVSSRTLVDFLLRIWGIDDTLEVMQTVVGGDIEEYMPFEDEVAIICNA